MKLDNTLNFKYFLHIECLKVNFDAKHKSIKRQTKSEASCLVVLLIPVDDWSNVGMSRQDISSAATKGV